MRGKTKFRMWTRVKMRTFAVAFARAHFADVTKLTDKVRIWDLAIRFGQCV